jgi:hypothetical protein
LQIKPSKSVDTIRGHTKQHVEGMGRYTVEQQLANLKDSGAYARILTDVEAEHRPRAQCCGGRGLGVRGPGDRNA